MSMNSFECSARKTNNEEKNTYIILIQSIQTFLYNYNFTNYSYTQIVTL